MTIGMLWFDNDPKKSLEDKIRGAASYYKTKYGPTPTLCFVHPIMVDKDSPVEAVDGMPVRTNRSVMPNHVWVGIGEETQNAKA